MYMNPDGENLFIKLNEKFELSKDYDIGIKYVKKSQKKYNLFFSALLMLINLSPN